VFVSNSTALSTNPNGYNQVYRKNTSTGTVDLVSVNTSGAVSTGNSSNPVVSPNGQFVAFDSDAADIVSGDTNGVRDVFIRDMSTQTTTAVSVTSAGVLGNGASSGPSMSSDGQKVAFTSAAPNLGYPAYQFHDNAVILRDRAHNTTTFASPMPHGWASSQAGDPGGGQNYFMQVKTGPQAISADGRYIVFDGKSAWHSGDAYCNGGASDENVYGFDTAAGVSTFLSYSNGAPLNDTCADHPAISSDGSTVVFRVAAPVYWVTSPSGALIQTLNPATSGYATSGVTPDNGGNDCGGGVSGYHSCGISDAVANSNGYRIAFSGIATNVVASDTNNAEDVFYLDRAGGGSQRVSLSTSGTQGNGASTAPSIRGDGTSIAFGSTATNLVSGDTNAASDAFTRTGLPAPAVPSNNLGTGETGLGGGFNDAEWALSCGAPQRNFVVPVEALSGNFWHTFDDISVPGRGMALHFTHTYNAAAASAPGAIQGPLGYGWTFPYNMTLTLGTGNPPATATVNQENGAQAPFSLVGGAYSAPGRVTATLVHNGDGTWTFTRHGTQIFTFNASGQLTAERDLNGYTTTIGSVGATQTITDPAGRTFTLTYTSGRITQLTDTASPPRSVAFAYNDGAGNLTDVTDVGGGNWHFTYDASHRMLTMRDPRGYTTTNHYDASGRVDWQQDQLNRQTSFDYTSIPGSTKITDPKGNVVVQAFANGLLTSETDGYGTAQAATTTYAYDPATLGCSTVTDPNLHVTTYTYDAQGNQLSKLDPLGHLTVDAYDGLNDLVSETDPNLITTTLAYDAAGNLLSRSTPLSGTCPGAQCQVTSYGYLGGGDTDAGDVTSMTDPNGKVTSYGYDANGDRTSVTDPVGNKTTLGFDTVGRLTSKVSPKGNVAGCGCTAQYTTS
jgi:YD repeat-containing protein